MSGIRNINKLSKEYNEGEIYFHQDLDGVCSFLAMKSYLENNNIKIRDSHIIQYGSLEFNIKNVKKGRLACAVDFAHIKDSFIIATDHHDRQSGVNSNMSTHFKKSRSNVETISGEISNNDIFVNTDIELIRTIDSADFLKYNITPEDIQKSIFYYNKKDNSERNRFLLGFVVNRLLLVFKNKRIKIKSLDGKREHSNKNLLECLVLDSNPTLYSLYLNLKHYMKNAIVYEWNFDMKSYHDIKVLSSQKNLNDNIENYISSRKEYLIIDGKLLKNSNLEYDSINKIVFQYNIGKTYETGAYDRYVVFNNFPDSNYICTIYEMGLVQISANPFKTKDVNIHLEQTTNLLLDMYKDILSNFRISLASIKKINENESYKLKKKYSDYISIGFKFNDLITFYKDDVYYLPNRLEGDLKTVSKLDLYDENNIDVQKVKIIMNKLYSEWTVSDKEEMSYVKISGLSIMSTVSGGHPSITNIQGFNFLEERKDAIKKYFGNKVITTLDSDGKLVTKFIENYNDIMVLFANDYLTILKNNINDLRSIC